MRKSLKQIFEAIKVKLNSVEFLNESRVLPKYFTRNRKLSFVNLVLFITNLVKKTLQNELTNFMRLFSSSNDDIKTITKSAFVQDRLKLKPEAFLILNDVLVKEFYTDNTIKRWKGYRLLGLDGMDIRLPDNKNTRAEFGCVSNSVSEVPMAKTSILYDVLNDITINGIIAPYKTSELSLAIEQIEVCEEYRRDIYLHDMGYDAIWYFYLHKAKNKDFIIRVRHGFMKEIDAFFKSDKWSEIIKIDPSEYIKEKLKELNISPYTLFLRLVKVKLDTGEIEVLVTSLLDEKKFPISDFGELYHLRWNSETNNNTLKNKVEIENFSGISPTAIKQDFYASIFVNNIQGLIQNDLEKELKQITSHRKYQYKINKNLSLSYLKDEVVRLFIEEDVDNVIEKLKKLFLQNPEPVRPGRKYPRNFKSYRRRYYNNMKRAF